MFKKLSILLLIIACSACKKNQQTTACGTQACTDIFVSIGVNFKDKTNQAVAVSNYTVLDLRTNKLLTNVTSATADLVPGYFIIADDSNRPDLTTERDDVKVSGTNPATNEVQSATFKISGGCNCHVAKVSGPETIVFTK